MARLQLASTPIVMPELHNLRALEGYDPSTNLILTWSTFSGRTVGERIWLSFAFSLGPTLVTNIIQARALSYQIPAGTLEPNMDYTMFFGFEKVQVVETNAIPGAVGRVYEGAGRMVRFRTGEPRIGPRILLQPNESIVLGEGQTLRISAQGEGTSLRYEWFKDGVSLGLGGATFLRTNARPEDSGLWHAIVSNAAGSTRTRTSHVTVKPGPQILMLGHPEVAAPHSPVTVWVSASPANATYQWFLNGMAMPGWTTPTLEFGGAIIGSEGGIYFVRVSNENGSVDSEPQPLFVGLVPPKVGISANAAGPSLRIDGVTGFGYTVMQSQDLRQWTPVRNVVLSWVWDEVEIPNPATTRNFYRVQQENPPRTLAEFQGRTFVLDMFPASEAQLTLELSSSTFALNSGSVRAGSYHVEAPLGGYGRLILTDPANGTAKLTFWPDGHFGGLLPQPDGPPKAIVGSWRTHNENER